jgi:hypothetical protein
MMVLSSVNIWAKPSEMSHRHTHLISSYRKSQYLAKERVDNLHQSIFEEQSISISLAWSRQSWLML